MTPVASTAAASRTGRIAVPRAPRRVSGPARRRPAPASPLLQRAAALADARLLDRLIRGRAWIAVIGVMLMGLVFVQVSMLRLNTGIGRDVATAAQLERTNQQLRNTVAELGAGEQIEAAAAKYGMVMPAAGKVHYLQAGRSGVDAAVRGISAPAPVQQQPLPVADPMTPTPATATPAAGVTPGAVTPGAATPTGVAAGQSLATQQQPSAAAAAQQTPPATTAPPAATQQAPDTTSPPTAGAASSGGAAPTP